MMMRTMGGSLKVVQRKGVLEATLDHLVIG